MSFDDPSKAHLPYEVEDVIEIERVRGKPYSRLSATVVERDSLAIELAHTQHLLRDLQRFVRMYGVHDTRAHDGAGYLEECEKCVLLKGLEITLPKPIA